MGYQGLERIFRHVASCVVVICICASGLALADNRTGAALACVEGHAPVTMMFMNPSLGVALGAGSTGGAGGACPSIEAGRTFNENLAAGEYHLVMTANGSPDAFDYQLQLTVIPSN